ncbi:MAG: hypothetical protein D3923_13385 [Candidatus Electrothrix sp. AR3]|nr:hypothetical protein [Candidatus Electrothrix sp. AR3]
MSWFYSIIKIAGASFPVASSLVQFQSELDSKEITKQIKKLNDPISGLHVDIPNVSKILYKKITDTNSSYLQELGNEFYTQYSRSLAILESHKYIKGYHDSGGKYSAGMSVIDPTYIMYMCASNEDQNKMEAIMKVVDECQVDEQLDGRILQKEIGLSLPVIEAVFKIYESKGYGFVSQEIGSSSYLGNV